MNPKNEIHSMLKALKIALKSKGMNYKVLAEKLELSEATVKRMFSKEEMTLTRLGQICEIAEIKFGDLIELSGSLDSLDVHIYTDKQELALSENTSLLAFLNHLINGSTPKQIKDKHKLTLQSVRSYLKELENLGFLENHPNDRVKLLIPKKVQWQKNGPLRKKLLPLALNEFLSSNFETRGELKKFLNIKLSEQSVRRFQTQIDELVTEINNVSRIEQSANSNLEDIGVLCAIRPWRFSALQEIK